MHFSLGIMLHALHVVNSFNFQIAHEAHHIIIVTVQLHLQNLSYISLHMCAPTHHRHGLVYLHTNIYRICMTYIKHSGWTYFKM